jgi:uncharacterized protein YfbU (UPF0304 family)
MKTLKSTEMTEIEALILTNQTVIMNAMALMAGPHLSKLLLELLQQAADVTLKEVDKYKI